MVTARYRFRLQPGRTRADGRITKTYMLCVCTTVHAPPHLHADTYIRMLGKAAQARIRSFPSYTSAIDIHLLWPCVDVELPLEVRHPTPKSGKLLHLFLPPRLVPRRIGLKNVASDP